jgi:hypothetical protein
MSRLHLKQLMMAFKNMKCRKTSTMDDYRSYLKHYGHHAVEILKFNMLNKFNAYVACAHINQAKLAASVAS